MPIMIFSPVSNFGDQSLITPPRISRLSGLKLLETNIFELKKDGEKWSEIFLFLKILLAPSELLLPSAKKSEQLNWPGRFASTYLWRG